MMIEIILLKITSVADCCCVRPGFANTLLAAVK
jgi:hypothetical protein